jgi:hypothetical protein
MKRITVETTVGPTPDGKFGAWLFVLAPVVMGICIAWYSAEALEARLARSSQGDASTVAAVLAAIAGMVWLGGALMVFYGRRYRHVVTIGEAEPGKAADSAPQPASPIIPPQDPPGAQFRPGMRRF